MAESRDLVVHRNRAFMRTTRLALARGLQGLAEETLDVVVTIREP